MKNRLEQETESNLIKRFLWTAVLIFVFRMGVHIPTPGVNTKALAAIAEQQGVGLLKLLNTFSGGALANFSIFALGIMPYISASIVMQLLTVIVPRLEQMQKESGMGRLRLNQITRALAIVLALIQGFLLAKALEAVGQTSDGPPILAPGPFFKVLAMLCLTAGTAFVLWLGEQINDKGIGNGTSLLIFSGIVTSLPSSLAQLIFQVKEGTLTPPQIVGIGFFLFALIVFIIFVELSFRKIPIHYAKKFSGTNVFVAQSSHLPLKLNMTGVMPTIFASTVLGIPITFASFWGRNSVLMAELAQGRWLYNTLFVALIFGFCYLYASIIFKPEDISENLKKQLAYIPGIRPGEETTHSLSYVVSRLLFVGGFFMNLVVLVPLLASSPYLPSGTSLLIIVSVALDAYRKVMTYRATQSYDEIFASLDKQEEFDLEIQREKIKFVSN